MSRRKEYDQITEPIDYVSIDGKSLAYRDPNNQAMIDDQIRGDDYYDGMRREDIVNEHSYGGFNKLYKFSYGQIDKAAKELGYNNINDLDEVDAVYDYMTTPRASQADLDNLSDSINTKDEQQTEVALEPPTPVEMSDREKAVKERVDNHSYTDVGMTLSPDGRLTFPSVTDNSSKASTDFLDDYKFKVKQGLDLAGIPTRGSGAVATPGGYAS